jgi:putative exporter of polyketide antibiotics
VIAPAIILAAILAALHVSAYVFIRGRAGARVPLLLVAAFLGSWAGDAVGGRLDADPVRIGDFHVLAASLFAWLGIGVVAILAVMAPTRAERGEPVPERPRSVNAG